MRRRGSSSRRSASTPRRGLLNPRSAAPALSAARAYLAQGDTDARACSGPNDAAAIEPGSGDVALVRGTIHERAGQTAEALAAYAAAVRANALRSAGARPSREPGDAHSDSSIAAQPQFEALLRMGYRPSRMHFGLAQIAEAKGDAKRAVGGISRGGPARAVVRGRQDGAGRASEVEVRRGRAG